MWAGLGRMAASLKCQSFAQLSRLRPCARSMKTFLKILLIALVIYAIIKLSPLIFVGAAAGLVVAIVFTALGVSLLGVTLGLALGVVMALAPIWLPVLAIIGAISLVRKDAPSAPPPAAPPVLPPNMPVAG